MNFIFEQIRVGGDRNFGYLLGDRESGAGALIDPAFSPELVVERAKAQNLSVKYILNTHGHHDHINGNERAKELTGAPIGAYHESDIHPELPIADGDEINIGRYTLRALHTPGHRSDHLVFALEAEPETGAPGAHNRGVETPKLALTGDLLFVGKVGGTSTDDEAKLIWASLQRVIRELPNETTLWPGHDYGCRPCSTLGWERQTNPFLLAPDLTAFLQLKAEWPKFKAKLGLK